MSDQPPLATDANMALLEALHALQSVGIRKDLQHKIVKLLWKPQRVNEARAAIPGDIVPQGWRPDLCSCPPCLWNRMYRAVSKCVYPECR
jgi:hypothetical protein